MYWTCGQNFVLLWNFVHLYTVHYTYSLNCAKWNAVRVISFGKNFLCTTCFHHLLSLSLSCSQSTRLGLSHGFDLITDIHAPLLPAMVCQDFRLICRCLMFLFATSLNLSLGHPWLLFPSPSCEYSSCLGSRSFFTLCTWSSHLRFFSIRMSDIHGRRARLRISSLVILPYHLISIMSLSCLIM